MTFLLDNLIKEDTNFLIQALQNDGNEIKAKVDALLYNFDQFVITGDSSFLAKELSNSSNLGDNCKPDILSKKEFNRRLLKKGVLVDITEENVPVVIEDIKIKQEKVSTSFVSGITPLNNVSVTSNTEEEMPAPKCLPPRKRKIKAEPLDVPKRSTRTRKKPTRYTGSEVANGKMSDVMIQNTTITMIDITGGDGSDKENGKNKEKGSSAVPSSDDIPEEKINNVKRAKTLKKTNINVNSGNDVDQSNLSGNKVMSEVSLNKSDYSEYADAKSSLENCSPSNQQNTLTLAANNQAAVVNSTFVVQNDKDEVLNKTVKVIQNTPQKERKNKEVFSPYDKVSTKRKVEAFEKLNTISRTSPIAHKTQPNRKLNEEGHQEFSTKQKPVTPLVFKTAPKMHSTTKVNKFIHRQESTSSGNSLLSTKSQSALKASQAEFREREKRRQEKEREAIKKREALLLALTEEKKRKREEKQMKAQQQREMLEKEKQKLVEMQLLKDHKYKQVLPEQGEKIQKQQRIEQKTTMVKKKAEEVKKQERKLPESGKRPQLPVYMLTEAPLLPTEDCYDTDDDQGKRSKSNQIPDWGRDYNVKKTQLVMMKIGEQIKNTFFCRQTHTPDLREMFDHIDPRKLKRTSSAVWRKPPRYTFCLENSSVCFSDDDDE